MKYIRKLPTVEEIIEEYPLTEDQLKKRKQYISEIQDILAGKSNRKILCIGPCSADREDAVVDYISKLAVLQEKIRDMFLIVPRVYTSKPRTKGIGYKGLLHRPTSDSGHDDLLAGVLATRKMHLHVIKETGMFCADEMLYPESIDYILDLLAYVAVGARSVEDQGHRMVASGLDIPVGMKNPLSGDLESLLNSIEAAQYPQSMIYRGWETVTDGNPYAHAILRGYMDFSGKMHVNYHYEDLCDFYDEYQKRNLKNMSLLVDCNHGNSRKRYDEQIRIAKEIKTICEHNLSMNQFIKGVMIESYIEDGAQLVGGGVYGKSITDACLGWDKTERLILDLYK